MKRKTISLVLSLVLLFALLPQGAVSADGTASAPGIAAGSVTASPGDTVDVEIKITDNPGILGARLTVSYDSALTLTDARSGEAFGALNWTKPGRYVSPCNFVWDGQELAAEDVRDGVILTLTFRVSEAAAAGDVLAVELSCRPGDFSDTASEPVTPVMTGGTVTVLNYTPGDVNGDGAVNTADIITLRRYLAGGYDVSVNTGAADVNDDVAVNTTDLILLRRYLAGGYGVVLKPSHPACSHVMEATAYRAATCTEDGHIAYWHCTVCGKYFSDASGTAEISFTNTVIAAAGHTVVVDPAVPATAASKGLTEGAHCSVCGEILVPQRETKMLDSHEHNISYDIANGDPYLMSLLAQKKIVNNNPDHFSEDSSLTLRNISVAGYRFLGWYDLPSGNNAANVKAIPQGTAYDVELYAQWEKIPYTVQFKSDIFLDENETTYTVDKGIVLPTPKLSNYVFAGWSDESGKLYNRTAIPSGTTGNIVLTANWTSERNKTWTKTALDAPVIYEDEENHVILFAYEIGEIQNVPLYTIKDFGYISGDGVTKTESATYSATVTESAMQTFAKVVANSTTESSNWTLSEAWNEVTSVNEQWCEENGYTREDSETIAKSDTNTWNVSSGRSGSTDTTHLETRENGWEMNSKVNQSSSHTDTDKTTTSQAFNLGAELTYSAGNRGGWGGGLSVGYSNGRVTETESTDTKESGWEVSGGLSGSNLKTDSTTTNSSWNSSSSYGGSSTSSASATTATALSEKISQTYGYGKSYTTGGSASDERGLSSTSSTSDEYSASVTYSRTAMESVTSSWTTQSTKPGYHRWVVAGTAHVFAVVGYDISSKSYFVYTYSVMDDETHEFEDYSYTSASYSDQQNGVIPFEIPYEVAEYVAERTSYSDGLKVNQATGTVTGYSGTDNCVVIPEYMNVGGGEVVKVTGINASAFRGNTAIAAVVLSDFITEIPDNAFRDCTSLVGIDGGSIAKIGDSAFSGCRSIVDCGVDGSVVSLGAHAFEGAGRLFASPANAGVAEAAAESGAKKIVLYLDELENGEDALSGITLTVPGGAEYFEIYGYGKMYRGLSIVSDAGKTILNKMTFAGSGGIPIRISSGEAVLNQVTVRSSGIALVFSAESAVLGLQGTVSVGSENANAVLCKDLTLYESNPYVDGLLAVDGKILVCGAVYNDSLLSYGAYETITADTFEKMLHSYTLYFDANGGNCDTASREVENGTAVGPLPVPERRYYTFVGWFLEDGAQVTEETVFSTGLDQTLHARWSQNTFTIYFDAGGGVCGAASKLSAYGETVGGLPSATREHFTFAGWFLSDGTQVSESTVFDTDEDQTLYARWNAIAYHVSWSAGAGCSITVSRTASPYGSARTGNLASGDAVYYGDILRVTYAASTGHSISSHGAESITVGGNVTSDTIYANASANKYTYNIVYRSSNGTSLGSSSYTNTYGSSSTITPKTYSGYATPAAQTVNWDSTGAKTITFTYTPNGVGTQTLRDNDWWWNYNGSTGIRYTVRVSFSNRTSNSVQATITWTNMITANTWYGYWQAFNMSIGNASTGQVRLAENSTWMNSSSSQRSVTKNATITISGLQPTTTSLSYSATASAYGNAANPGSFSGTLTIPAY